MSTVRKTFWQLVKRLYGGVSCPWKYGLSGCIPALMSSVDGSWAVGTSDADGSRRWSRDSKKARNRSRISSVVMEGCSLGAAAARDRHPHRLREPLDAPARGPHRAGGRDARPVRVDRETARRGHRAARRQPRVDDRAAPPPDRRALLGV